MSTITTEPAREHAGHLAASNAVDGWRFTVSRADRRAWLRDHLEAARDPATLDAMRDIEQILMADGDQREPYAAARERLRVALVRRAVREAVRPAR